MSEPMNTRDQDRDLIKALARSGAAAEPPAGWEEGVRRRLRTPTAPVRTLRVWPVAALAFCCLFVGIFGTHLYYRRQIIEDTKVERAALRAETERITKLVEAKAQEVDETTRAIEEAFETRLAAKTEEERISAERALASAKAAKERKIAEMQRLRERQQAAAAAAAARKKKKDRAERDKCNNSSDPLCGL